MKSKLSWGAMLLFCVSAFLFSSCSDDEDDKPAKPVVQITELGSGHDSPDDKKAIAGSSLHLEAEIEAEGTIALIQVEIHAEEGDSKIEKSFTEGTYIGVLNTEFHEHIDIPAETPAGAYHLHLTVTDQLGQTTTAESDLTIEAASVNIQINDLTFGAGHDFPDNKIGYIGTSPYMEGSITAENGIDRIYIMMHSEDANAFEIDTTFTYNGETEIENFHKHILIPEDAPAGSYHLHFKVYDQTGESKQETMTVEIKETGITVDGLEIGSDNSAKASNIHTEFDITATDALSSIRIRIYKEDEPSTYFYNETFTDDFADDNVKQYTFHKHLQATDAVPGNYIMEIRVNDNKNAYVLIKENLTIIAE